MRVLDLSRVLAGPLAGRMLSDLGADVVKVEPPEGDITRMWGEKVHGIAGYFNQQNVGKRGMCIDLKSEDGKELVRSLADHADVLLENFRPGVMGRLGLDYPRLQARNPRLVMLSISGFGADGPESGRAAYAPIIHAESGLIHRQARLNDGHATDIAVSLADTNASLHGLVALLAALLLREKVGTGQHIDLAMIDAAFVTDDRIHFALDDAPDVAPLPSEVWPTAGGQMVLAGDLRYIWRQLQRHFDLKDPTPEGAPLADKIRNRRAAAKRFFRETCPDRTAVIAALDEMNIAWGDVRSPKQIQALPTIEARRSVAEVDDRLGGIRKVPQTPYRFSNAQAGVRSGAPHQGEHNVAVLRDWLQLDATEIAEWQHVLVDARS